MSQNTAVTDSKSLELSVVIPAYNEELRLPSTLIDMVDYFDKCARSYELIVVDDGSRDGTIAVVEKFSKLRGQVRLVKQPRNMGKGAAVRAGVLAARGEHILFADADGATPIAEIERLENVLRGGFDVAIGSRAVPSNETKVVTNWYRKFLGQSFNRIINFLVLPGIVDTQCGFKIFKRKPAQFLFSNQRSNQFSFDVEILYLAKKVGLKVLEVPINWRNIPGSKVNLVVDAGKMFMDVLTFKFRHRKINEESYRNFQAIMN